MMLWLLPLKSCKELGRKILTIVGAGVDTMKREFESDPGFILADIGPSPGPCCSEFLDHESEIPENFLIYKRGKNHFDFWQITIDQLVETGLRPENIELSRICTKCSHDFFSPTGMKKQRADSHP